MLSPYYNANEIEAGCDEAGRGCLAGPVYAAAVILPKNFKHPLLNDSKLLTEAQRQLLRPIIKKEALAWAVASFTPRQIDLHNILRASFLTMHKALNKLKLTPTSLLIDGNRFIQYKNIPHHCIIKGDSKYASIAAASVLAKTYRDDYMKKLAKKFPDYQWLSNKGYPTKAHRAGIQAYGPTPHHRMTFRLLAPNDQGKPFEG